MLEKLILYFKNKKEDKLKERYKTYGAEKLMDFEEFKEFYTSL